jgi:hypothetical protein
VDTPFSVKDLWESNPGTNSPAKLVFDLTEDGESGSGSSHRRGVGAVLFPENLSGMNFAATSTGAGSGRGVAWALSDFDVLGAGLEME